MMAILTGVRSCLLVFLICISLIISDLHFFFSCANQPSVYLLWRNVYSGSLPIFQLGSWVFLLLGCVNCLYVLKIKSLSVASFETIFSHSVDGLVFVCFFMVSFLCKACQFEGPIGLFLLLFLLPWKTDLRKHV